MVGYSKNMREIENPTKTSPPILGKKCVGGEQWDVMCRRRKGQSGGNGKKIQRPKKAIGPVVDVLSGGSTVVAKQLIVFVGLS